MDKTILNHFLKSRQGKVPTHLTNSLCVLEYNRSKNPDQKR